MEAKKTVQVKITSDVAKRVDEVVNHIPTYAHRQHFVRVAVEELLRKTERKVNEAKAA